MAKREDSKGSRRVLLIHLFSKTRGVCLRPERPGKRPVLYCFSGASVLELLNCAGKDAHVQYQAVQRHVFIGLMCQLLLAGNTLPKATPSSSTRA